MSGQGPATVLVVDDEEAVRFVCRVVLEGLGLRVEEAVDGLAALDRIAAGGIDAVVSDLTMPRMDGVALRAQVAERQPGMPFLLWSTVPRPGDGATVKDPMDPGFATRVRELLDA